MKHRSTPLLITLLIVSLSCSEKPRSTDQSTYTNTTTTGSGGEDTDVADEEVDYPDGRYCARVEYYYSKTGTSSTYTLAIDIEDGEVDRIHWPNGGWLDNSHFSSADISDGTAQFESFEGVDYQVTVLGHDGECSLSTSAVDEDDLVQQAQDAQDESMQEMIDEQERDRIRVQEEEEREEEEQKRRQEQEETEKQQENQEEPGK